MVLTNLLHGLTALGSFSAAAYLLVGMVIGMLVAMLPGLGTAVALSILLPFVYHMKVIDMVALMLGAQAGGYYTASITAIVLNTPGAPESYPTTFDGFPMTERGEAGRALAISAVSTWMGAWISSIIFVGLLQFADPLVTTFKAPDYVGVIIMALVLVGLVGEVPIQKVLISGGVGLMLSFVGSDPVSAVDRFTFGLPQLVDGINVVPFALGIFAITQIVIMYGTGRAASNTDGKLMREALYGQAREGIGYTFRHPVAVVRSASLAAVLGLLPGIGGFAGNYISYSIGKRTSRVGHAFGSGVPEGVMSAEGSSLAKEVGSLLPAVALGLPSGIGMVLFIAAMTIVGLQPGEALLRSHPSLPYSMMWVMAITGLLSCAVGLALSPWLSRVSRLRGPVLFPFIAGLAVLGSYVAIVNRVGMVELLVFAVIGLLARKGNYSLAAMVIGLVLGATFDDQVHVTAETYGWSFIGRDPIADLAILASLALIAARLFGTVRKRRRLAHAAVPTSDIDARQEASPPHRDETDKQVGWLDVATAVIVLGCSAWYFGVSLGYPTAAGLIPAVVSIIVVAAAVVELAAQVVSLRRAAAEKRASSEALVPSEVGVAAGTSGPAMVGRRGEEASVHSGREEPSGQSPRSHPRQDPQGGHTSLPRRWFRRVGAREVGALVWVVAFVVAALLLGFEVGLPVVGGLFCISATRWPSRFRQALFTLSVITFLVLLAAGFVHIFHFQYSGLLL